MNRYKVGGREKWERSWIVREETNNAKESGFCLAGDERSLTDKAGLINIYGRNMASSNINKICWFY